MKAPDIIYGLISFACPFVGFILASILEMLVFTDYWHPLEKGVIEVGAALGTLIGCMAGLLFALLSLKHQSHRIGLGTGALLFNLLPILAAILLLVAQLTAR